MNIESAYADADDLAPDAGQVAVVELLSELQQTLDAAGDKQNGILKFLRRSSTPVRGLYIWGGVGRGKTFLMDLFFATLDTTQKRRVHFHRMMSEVHARLKLIRDVEHPVDTVADAIAEGLRVLCFDEFFVKDIGDAMILSRLLDGLFKRDVTLVATSNLPPADLYKDGLQRDRFLPAIRLLETHTRIVELDGGTDYRLRLLEQAGTYLAATDEGVDEKLTDYFCRIAPGATEAGRSLDVLGRPIPTVRSAKGVVWFEFSALCEGPRSQEDYIEIARCYQTVILSNVPILNRGLEDPARRFIALVDEFYDRRVKLILSAHAPIDDLYQGQRLTFEFDRTRSRLSEMQSKSYLHAPHLC